MHDVHMCIEQLCRENGSVTEFTVIHITGVGLGPHIS